MKKIIFVLSIVLLLNLSLVNAVTQQELSEAKSLIDSKTDCKSLSNSQLEIIGEYYMEQMHPGESHEIMHKMMGLEEGSEAEEQFHINMAKTIYCNENVGGMIGGGMMAGSGMMGNNYQTQQYNSTLSSSLEGFEIFFYIMLTLVIVVLILIMIFLKNNAKQKRKR